MSEFLPSRRQALAGTAAVVGTEPFPLGTWRTDVRVVDTIAVRDTPTTTASSFVVEAGSSTIHQV